MTAPLVYVKATTVYPVPPVYSGFWTAADWARTARVVVEPLVVEFLGEPWTATGDRNAAGELLYVKGVAR